MKRMHLQDSRLRGLVIVGVGLFIIIMGVSLPIAKSRVESWRKDLDVLARKLPKKHRNLYHTVSEEEFARAVSGLREKIPDLDDAEISVELARVLARVGDGDTHLYLLQPNTGFRIFPLRLFLYDEGLYVTAATPAYRRTIGTKVLRVGRLETEEALKRVAPLVSADSAMDVKLLGPIYLRSPEILHALGLSDSVDSGGYLLEDERGEVFYAQPKALSLGRVREVEFLNWVEAKGGEDPRLAARHPERYYWFEYLKEEKAVYVQFNQVENEKEEKLSAFCRRLFEFLDQNPVERLILDLRWNGGGRNKLIPVLVDGLAGRPLGRERGGLLVLVGRGTHQAAARLVRELEQRTEAVFVGEPIRAHPRHDSEAKWIRLPESKLRVSYSSEAHPWAGTGESRPWPPPLLPVPQSIQDAQAGIDRALEAALEYPGSRAGPSFPHVLECVSAMEEKPRSSRPAHRADRRHFLRDTLRGSVPLLIGLSGDPESEPDSVSRDAESNRTSPPPEAESHAPSSSKDQLDRIQEEFNRDNPDLTTYPSESNS